MVRLSLITLTNQTIRSRLLYPQCGGNNSHGCDALAYSIAFLTPKSLLTIVNLPHENSNE
jgi:hypothetical protein